jgi:hypothetical protein
MELSSAPAIRDMQALSLLGLGSENFGSYYGRCCSECAHYLITLPIASHVYSFLRNLNNDKGIVVRYIRGYVKVWAMAYEKEQLCRLLECEGCQKKELKRRSARTDRLSNHLRPDNQVRANARVLLKGIARPRNGQRQI